MSFCPCGVGCALGDVIHRRTGREEQCRENSWPYEAQKSACDAKRIDQVKEHHWIDRDRVCDGEKQDGDRDDEQNLGEYAPCLVAIKDVRYRHSNYSVS